MKKIICFVLSGILALSFCSCAVFQVSEGKNASYFAYKDTSGKEANAVLISEFKNFNDLDGKLNNYLTKENRVPIVDLTKFFFKGSFTTQQMRELRYLQVLTVLSKYEKRVYALSLDGFTDCGVTREEIEPFIRFVKQSTPRIKLFTGEEINADESYYALFDGVILKGDKTPSNLPQGTELWVKGKSENVSALAKRADAENIRGIIIEDKETELTNSLGKTVKERANLDFAKINQPTFEYLGFYHSNGWYGPDCYEEIAALNMTNCVFASGIQNLEPQIEKAVKNGFEYVLIYINSYLNYNNGKPIISDEFDSHIALTKALVHKYGQRIIFYGEEPYVQNISKEVFLALTKRLREEFPDNIILTCMGDNAFSQADSEFFKYCTDLAYDRYAPMTLEERENHIKRLTQIAKYGQRFWLIPWACEVHDSTEELLLKDLETCYTLIKKYDRVVGLLPFTYENAGKYGDWGLGLKEYFNPESPHYMPDLKAAYTKLGKEFLDNKN